MNKNLAIGGVGVLVLVVIGAWFLMQGSSSTTPSPTTTTDTQMIPTDVPATSGMENGSSDSATQPIGLVKEFIVNGSGFKFDQATMTVQKGDRVRITFKSAGGTHDFVIDEFEVKTKVLNTGQQEIIEFTADKSGSFEYYCSVANHKAMGMKGNLIVQ